MLAAGCRTVGVEEGSPRANARCLVQHLEIPQFSGWHFCSTTERLTMADMVEISHVEST